MSDKSVRRSSSTFSAASCAATCRGRVIAAVRDLGVPVPIVIRMEGTNVEKGKEMLKGSGLKIHDGRHDARGGRERVVALAGYACGPNEGPEGSEPKSAVARRNVSARRRRAPRADKSRQNGNNKPRWLYD